MKKRKGRSHEKRIADVNRVYEQYRKTGLSNREIWKRYIYPVWGLCERQFYNLLKKDSGSVEDIRSLCREGFLFPELFDDDGQRSEDYFKKI